MATKELRFKLTADTNLLKSQLEKAMTGPAKMLEKAVSGIGGGAGGVASALKSFPGGAGGAALGIAGSVIGLLKIISDRIGQMNDRMKEASASYDAAKQMQEKIYNLALKPMGDVMTQLMRPYLMLMLRQTRETVKAIQPHLKGAAAGNQADIDAINQLIQANLMYMANVTGSMEDIIKPVTARIAGFKDATDILFNRWATGTKEYVEGFLTAMDQANMKVRPMTDAVDLIVGTMFDVAHYFAGEAARAMAGGGVGVSPQGGKYSYQIPTFSGPRRGTMTIDENTRWTGAP